MMMPSSVTNVPLPIPATDLQHKFPPESYPGSMAQEFPLHTSSVQSPLSLRTTPIKSEPSVTPVTTPSNHQQNNQTPGQLIAEKLAREMKSNKEMRIEGPDDPLSGSLDEAMSPFNYNGDALSPEHPRNFPVTPVVESGREIFYCHICSFSGSSRNEFTDHLDGHFEHKCEKCDYTSRTEGRLKQHVQRFHHHENEEDLEIRNALSVACNGRENNTSPSAPNRQPLRQKTYRCKQCEYSTTVKNEFWNHARVHIREEKLLPCPKCPFVTEYKHHLEYHLRNHFGQKPFKCTKCNYACVNKSMLNSHMKSHTNIYQYRCADCTYATKYCHSLKLHLRKYNHKPASIINLDGTIDHDTSSLLTMKRSGPAKSTPPRSSEAEMSPSLPNSTNSIPQFHTQPPNMMPFWPLASGICSTPPLMHAGIGSLFRGLIHPPPNLLKPSETRQSQEPFSFQCKLCDFYGKSKELLFHHMIAEHPGNSSEATAVMNLPMRRERQEMEGINTMSNITSINNFQFPPPTPLLSFPPASLFTSFNAASAEFSSKSTQSLSPAWSANPPNNINSEAPLDLSRQEIDVNTHDETQRTSSSPTALCGRKRSRKGKAYKLDALCLKLQEKMEGDEVFAPANEMMSSDGRSQSDGSISANPYGDGTPRNSIPNVLGLNNNNNNNDENESLDKSHEEVMETEIRFQGKMTSDHPKSEVTASPDAKGDLPVGSRDRYTCPYCDISFTNCIMYTMHMGYHGYQKPFKCNICGVESSDKVSFFLHIARAPHA